MRVAGLGYSDGARSLEVMLESLSGGRRREIQEDGIVMVPVDIPSHTYQNCVTARCGPSQIIPKILVLTYICLTISKADCSALAEVYNFTGCLSSYTAL